MGRVGSILVSGVRMERGRYERARAWARNARCFYNSFAPVKILQAHSDSTLTCLWYNLMPFMLHYLVVTAFLCPS
jgi:hypothetical protein